MLADVHPSIVRAINSARKLVHGRTGWDDVMGALEIATGQVNRLEDSYKSEIRPLIKVEGAESLQAELYVAIEGMKNVLQACKNAVQANDPESLSTEIQRLDEIAMKIAVFLTQLRQAQDDSLIAAPVKIISDVILLGIDVSRQKADPELLRERLPRLQEYVNYVEYSIGRLKESFPEEKELISFFEEQLQRLQQGAGGVFLYLEEGGNVEDLVIAVSLLDRAGNDLWPAFSALNQLYIENEEFSPDPEIEKAYQELQKYKKGESNWAKMKEALGNLQFHHGALAADLVHLENFTLIKPSVKEQYFPKIIDLMDKKDLVLAYMSDKINSHEELEKGLEQYNELTRELDGLLAEMRMKLESKADISGASHFEEFLDLISKAYEEKVSDVRLERKAVFLDEFAQDFRRQLLLQERHHPETIQAVDKLNSVLDKHQEGIDLVYGYLDNEDPEALPKAYEIIEQATEVLVKLKRELDAMAEESGQGGMEVNCPFCGESNAAGAVQCSKCGRKIVAPSSTTGASVLDLTESGGAPEKVSGSMAQPPENFAFIKRVVEDVTTGLVNFEEAEELLAPYWERIQEVNAKLQSDVHATVTKVNDRQLTARYDEFVELMAYFESVMQEVFTGIEMQNVELLKKNIQPINDTGLEMSQLHSEFESATKSSSEMEFTQPKP